jgi:amidase
MTATADTELAFAGPLALAAKLRARELSARELVELYLRRIETLNPALNAFRLTLADEALAAATRLDEAGITADSGPLTGVPIAVKDDMPVAGQRMTYGSRSAAEIQPADAEPLRRLRAAGAIPLGITNVPELMLFPWSASDANGITRNPWNTARTPGGSSGGSAAALACGFTPLELGSDIGGSIRLPSHMSGIVGHKPSYGIVPAHGQIPGPPGTLTLADLAVAGPMARTIQDLKLGLDIMAGPNRWEKPAWHLELPPPRRPTLKQYRVAAWLDDPACRVEPEVGELLASATQKLAAAGVRVDHDARPEFTLAKVADTFFALLQAALAGGVPPDRLDEYAATVGDMPAAHTRRLLAMRHRQWLSYNERRLQMRKRWEEFFTQWDAILLPVMPCPAMPHDHSEPMASRMASVGGERRPYWDLTIWMAPAGACYLPVTVIPVGRLKNGLPIGIQIVGAYLHDRTTLDLAEHLLPLVGGCPRPPGF